MACAVKVADRAAAEKLTNTKLFIDRSALPPPDDDEYYLADLIGLTAVDPAATPLGTVSVVHDYGAGASFEIDRRRARRCWCRSPPPACRRWISPPAGWSSCCRTRSSSPARTRARTRRHDLARLRPDAVSGDVSGSARPVAGRAGAGNRRLVAGRRPTSAISPPDRHRTVDDTPFGGGAGMVLRPDIVDAAVASVADDRPVVCLTPRGRRFTQADAQRFAAGPGVILLCGRYEGIDQRVIEARGDAGIQHRRLRAVGRRTRRRWCCWTASCGCCPA